MRLLGRSRLRPLYGHDPQTDLWLRGWESEVSHANWKVARDLLTQFPRARLLGQDTFEFPVAVGQMAITLAVMFPQSVALIDPCRLIK